MNDLPNTATPTRVFLSYARGDDEAFVRRLHADLTKAGFTVWFDRESLMARGLTFHQEIKDAIRTEVDRVVYVGGPKAAISPFVREEWQFALECDHVVVTPILRLGDYEHVPGELSLLHCEDFRDDAKYDAALAKLVAGLCQPNPKLGALFAVPSLPPHFLGRPDLLRKLKEAVLVDLQKPVIVSSTARVGVQGMGGIGKSVLAAALARDREVRRSYPDGVIWVTFGQHPNLAQLQRDVVKCLGGTEQFENETQGREVLRQLLVPKAVCLVLDDVWEALHAQAFEALGPRCRAVVTTRDAGILHTLQGVLHQVHLFTEAEALQLLADSVNLPPCDLPPEAATIVRECGCLPLAVALCGGMAKRGTPWCNILERLRRADLDKIADRNAINEQHHDIYCAMLASVEVLDPDQQRRYAELAVFATDQMVPAAAIGTLWLHTGHLDDLDTDDLLRNFHERSLIHLDPTCISLHDLLHDFAAKLAGDLKALNQALLDSYRAKCPTGWPSGPNDGYFLQNLGFHLIAAGKTDELAELHLDLRWLEAKNEAGLTFDLPLDFAEAQRVGSPTKSRYQLLCLLEEALRRDIHFIAQHARDYPQALFQCLWNSGWWFDCSTADKHYQCGQGPRSNPGEKLCDLLQKWRVQKDRSMPNFTWVRSLRPPVMHLGTAQRAVLRGFGGYVSSVCYSRDGRWLVSGASDSTVRLWDLASGRELSVLHGHEGCVTSVSVLAGSRHIVSGADDGTLRIWDVAGEREPKVLRGHDAGVTSVCTSLEGKRIVSASNDKTVRLWDAESGRELAILRAQQGDGWHMHGGGMLSVALSPDEGRVASCADGGILRVWDLTSGRELIVLQVREGRVLTLAFSPDGRHIASGADDGILQVWDATNGREVVVLRGHKDKVTSVSYSPDGSRIVSGSFDKTVRVWDAATGAELAVLCGHEFGVTSVCYSPDALWIVSAAGDKTLRVWDAVNGARLAVLREHEGWVRSISYSPSGRQIASGAYDRTVRVWDAESGTELAVLRGHEGGVLALNWSADGRRLFSRSQDKTERVWDVASGECVEVIRITDDVVNCASEPTHSHFRVMSHAQETVIELTATRQRVGLFPAELNPLATHPTGCKWAGANREHLFMISLEGTIS